MQLEPVGRNIWTYEGGEVSFYGFPFPTRMTVIQLPDNRLWIHSPEKLNEALQDELAALGEVRYLISPNKLHNLFLQEWLEAYPGAKSYSAPGLAKKRKDLRFDFELLDAAPGEWQDVIAQTIFRGSPAMEEAVFFHKPSSTLIVTDLIENFDPDTLNWWQKRLANFAGILSPHGKTPIDWRASFMFGDIQQARHSLQKILSWQPEQLILSHGECVLGGATKFLTESFHWLAGKP